jgi:DNA polymerase III epsilon subunit family exonuclease
MQLRLDAADRLVELVEERHGAVPVEEAARALFALSHLPGGMARSLLDDVVDADGRLAWRGGAVALAASRAEHVPLEDAKYCVVDLETTGLSPVRCQICEIGAVRIERLELTATLETLVNPRERLPPHIAALTGIDARDLHRAPRLGTAIVRFLEFAGDAVLVAHNARFDLAFLDASVLRLRDRRLAAPVVDTVWLARKLLAGRTERFGLASLAQFFGTGTRPCHRALPDAEATAEILLHLIGLAQERGARTVADLVELSAPRRRRVYGKRSLAFGAPTRPGVYLFRDAHGQVLYVGRARDLRARLRSYFRSDRQRPAVEAALGAVESIEWRVLGSELEAALEELRLLRELRPPANARSTRPDRYVYLRARGDRIVVTRKPTPHGPLKSRRRAELAARALEPAELDQPRAALPRLRRRLDSLAGALRYEDAARFRDRVQAVEALASELDRLKRLRESELCLIAPAVEPGFRRAFFVAGGRVAAVRTLSHSGRLELDAGLAEARRAEPSIAPEDADELLVVAQFLRRPPPELRVLTFGDLSAEVQRTLAEQNRTSALRARVHYRDWRRFGFADCA